MTPAVGDRGTFRHVVLEARVVSRSMSGSRACTAMPWLALETEVGSVEGRSVRFRTRAHDGNDTIGEGRRRRAIVALDRFTPEAMAKAQEATT